MKGITIQQIREANQKLMAKPVHAACRSYASKLSQKDINDFLKRAFYLTR